MRSAGLVTLGILAGGQATRLGGADKAWARYQGCSLIERTLAVLGDERGETLASHNGPPGALQQLGLRVVPDLRPGFPGPLAGIESLLEACPTDWLLVVPVDLRRIPDGLRERMLECSRAQAGNVGVLARDSDGLQPLVSLWPVKGTLAAVHAALDRGRGSVRDLQQSLHFACCELPGFGFGNLNTPDDFR